MNSFKHWFLVCVVPSILIGWLLLHGRDVIDTRIDDAARDCASRGGAPLVASPYVYCMTPESMVGFPDVHPIER